MRNQFTMFRSFWDAEQLITKPQDRLSFLEAICAYALDEEERPLTGTAAAMFLLVKPTLVSSANKAKNRQTKQEQNKNKTKSNEEQNRKEKEKEKEGEKEREKEKEIENECYKKKRKEKEAQPRFTPPSVEEVAAYCRERGNQVDPERFHDFYASKGWKVGSQTMKDWKAAVRTWEKREQQKLPTGNAVRGGGEPGEAERAAVAWLQQRKNEANA